MIRADRIFINGNVITGDTRRPTCSALAVDGERFSMVGDDQDVLQIADQATKFVDLRGRTVIPGLIDTHAHMDREGLKTVFPSLTGAKSIADILGMIEALVRQAQPGEWIVTMPLGTAPSYWDPEQELAEKRYPTRWELDEVSPDNPVYIRPIWGFWRSKLPLVSVANSCALERCGIDRETPSPASSVELQRDKNGELTGIFVEHTFMSVVELTLMKGAGWFTHEDRVAALERSMEVYSSYGTTSVFEGHGAAGELIKAYYALKEKGPFTVRANLLLSPSWTYFGDVPPATLLGTWGAWLGLNGIGDSELRIAGLYVCAEDESDANRSPEEIALRASAAPYTGWAGFHHDASLPRDKVRDLLVEAARADIRCAAMTPDMLDLFEEVDRIAPIRDRRWVLGHISTLTQDDIGKIRDLGLVVSTHTNRYIWRTGKLMSEKVGPGNETMISPAASLMKAGVPVTFGTDNVPVSMFYPIWQSVARRDRSTGMVVGPSEAISREDALRAATAGGAYLTFEEDLKGTIEQGKLADFACLTDDPLTVSEDALKDLVAEFTVVGGRTVFQRDGAVTPPDDRP